MHTMITRPTFKPLNLWLLTALLSSSPRLSSSGPSRTSAPVSGVATLILQQDLCLMPNEVKCRLMASTRTAQDKDGNLAYSIFQQGAGQVNAYDAMYGTASGCANRVLDISEDQEDQTHYGGLANQDEDGNYYIMELDGYAWSD